MWVIIRILVNTQCERKTQEWVTLAHKSRPSLPASYGYIKLNDMPQLACLIKFAM